jgi:hypothetical protein
MIMRNPPRLSGALGSLRKGVVVAAIAYLLVTAVAALATPMFSGKNPAFAVWLGGGLIFLVAVVRLANRSSSASSGVKRVAGSLLLALGVTVVVAFLSFVLMVNIWEQLGLGH